MTQATSGLPDEASGRAAGALPRVGTAHVPWQMWLLAVVTAGIYALYHHYRINRELRDYGIEVDPAKSALAAFPGAVVVFPYLISVYRTGGRIATAQEAAGLEPTCVGLLGLLGGWLALLNVAYYQSEINRVWAASTGSGPGMQA